MLNFVKNKQQSDLEIKQQTNDQLDLTVKKAKQIHEKELANESKAATADQIYNGGSSSCSDEFALNQQVNATLDSKLDNENDLSIDIDNEQKCNSK